MSESPAAPENFTAQLKQIAANLHRQHKTNALIDRLTTSISADTLGRAIFPGLRALIEDCLNGELYPEGRRTKEMLERIDHSWVGEETVLSAWKVEKSKPVTRTESTALIARTQYHIELPNDSHGALFDLLSDPLYDLLNWFSGYDRYAEVDADKTNTLIQFTEIADVFI